MGVALPNSIELKALYDVEAALGIDGSKLRIQSILIANRMVEVAFIEMDVSLPYEGDFPRHTIQIPVI